jgi:hypothetical protein
MWEFSMVRSAIAAAALCCALVLATAGAAFQETVAPGNAAPERDARGIPVVSDPAVAPAGTNQPVVVPPGAQLVANPNQAAAFATQPSTGEKPPCSRTITDNCTQTYEVGVDCNVFPNHPRCRRSWRARR